MFTTVAAYTDPIEAQLALGRLEAEGIPARLDDTGTAIANWEWRLAIGGMRLRVPDGQVVHARRVLAALDAGEYAVADDWTGDDEDEHEDAHARARVCADGGHDSREALRPPHRETLSSRIAWAALMLFGIPLPWRRPRDDGTVVREA